MKLTIEYMIGDSAGTTKYEATISKDNPFLGIFTGALKKLVARGRQWGIALENETFEENYNNGRISKLEYDLLQLIDYYCFEDEAMEKFCKEHGFENSEANLDYLTEFDDLLISETSYSFLTYEGYKLTGKKN